MDYRYANALRNAANAWAHNHVTDALSLREQRRQRTQQAETRAITAAPGAREAGIAKPELARFGNLGTRLNLFA